MPRKKKAGRRSNGEGSIRQKKDKRWEFQYTEYDPITGESKRKYLTMREDQENEFLAKVCEIRLNLRKGKSTEPCKIPLWDWINEWLYVYKKNKTLKATTFDSYELTAVKHIKSDPIGLIPIGQLKTEDLQRFYDSKLKNSNRQWAECQNKKCKNIIDDKELIEKYKRQHTENRICPKCNQRGILINKGIGIRTVHYLRTQIIGGALEKARLTYKIEHNPNEGTEIPELKYKETEPFTFEQVQHFLNLIKSDEYSLAIKFDLGTGVRLGELLSLKWDDIDFKNKTIKINRTVERVRRSSIKDNPDILEVLETINPDTKTVLVYQKPKTKKSESNIPIPPKLIPLLEEHKNQQNILIMKKRNIYKDRKLVFCQKLGQQIDPKNFRDHFQYLLRSAGLPENTFHALRHTFGALLLELGEDMKVIQELMRHEDYNTTANIYVKVAEKLKKKAITKIDSIL